MDNIVEGSIAIDNKYCFAVGGSEDVYVYKDIEIKNYDTGIETSYGSGIISYDNCDITNSIYGITSLYNTYSVIRNCDVTGRDNVSNSYGIKTNSNVSMSSGLTNCSSLEDFIEKMKAEISNCTVDNTYTGIVLTSGNIHIYQTDISNCNSGIYTQNSGTPFVNECNITAKATVDETSYGVYASPSGGEILNSTITGFNIGAYNPNINNIVEPDIPGNTIADIAIKPDKKI